jgi:hypothetical protein
VVLNKGLTVWLDGARPANTCIPCSFPVNATTQPCGEPNPKNKFARKNNYQNLTKSLFIEKKNKSKEEFNKLTFAKLSLLKKNLAM